MARKYSGARGKSGSTRPSKRIAPTWITHTQKEIELLITKLAKEGKSSAVIGLQLRDEYGVPDVKASTGKSVSAILKEKNLQKEIPEDLMAVIRRAVLLRKHIELNHKDMTARRGLLLTESKIKKLIKYYKTTHKLPLTWKYDPAKIKLIVE